MLREAHPMKWQAAVVRGAYFRLRCQNPVAGCGSERPMPNGFAISDYAAALRALNRFGHLLSPTLRLLFQGCIEQPNDLVVSESCVEPG